MFTTAPLANLYDQEQEAGCERPDTATQLQQKPSFAVLYRAVEYCVEKDLFKRRDGYDIFEMALTAWSHVHGIAMLRVTNFRDIPTDLSPIDRASLDVLYLGLSARNQ